MVCIFWLFFILNEHDYYIAFNSTAVYKTSARTDHLLIKWSQIYDKITDNSFNRSTHRSINESINRHFAHRNSCFILLLLKSL